MSANNGRIAKDLRTPPEWGGTGRNSSDNPLRRDFAKPFERGKLTFTGDVLQVIFIFGCQQKFAKLLKRLTVGAYLSWLERYLDTLLWFNTPNNLETVGDRPDTYKYAQDEILTGDFTGENFPCV
jgi:hypothetical protein